MTGEILSFPQQPEELQPLPRVQRINGYPLNLGTMSYDQLMTVYGTCQDRMAKAAADGDVVAEYLDRRFGANPWPETPGPEAA